ncbi:MAG TPA: transglycosylase domain-containing protein, partial [Candidatus Paceibacterota bacterium]
MKKSRIKFFLKTSVIAAVSIFAIAAAAAAAWVFVIFKNLPPPELLQNHKIAESTKIYDRTGKIVLFEVYGEERRVVVPFEEIPDLVKKATIAIEDEDFYRHSGFEIKSILRAFIKNFLEGRVVQGGSTITQQLIKKSFLSDERTISRKIKELFLAINIEKQLSKDEILALYLNQIPYGSNAYGVEAASQIFFEKSVKDLSLGEAAALASLPKAPSFYSPWGPNKDALLARRNMTIKKMGSLAFITESEEKAALEEDMAFAKPATGIKAPHFVMMVQDYLNQQYGEDFVRTGGLRVITTLDWEMQQLAEKVIREGAKRNSELYRGTNAALVAQDSNTGQILALVGSKDYFDTEAEGNFNVAAQGLRQPGSTIKPFVYVAAFKKGYTPETIVFDLETEFDTTHDPEKSYKPVNYDGKFRGPITLKSALAQSINVPSVKTLYLAGLNDALRTAKAFGLTTLTERSRYGLSLVLGGGEVKLIDLVGAYSVFSEDGIKRKQSLILEISSKDKILERLEGDGELVMEPQYIRLINDILSDAQARAPIFGSSLNIPALEDYQIAVKTGTTNDYRDAWAVGY